MKLPASHPIWRTINLVVIILGLAGILYINATNFDEGELKAIVEIAAAYYIWDAAKKGMTKNAD